MRWLFDRWLGWPGLIAIALLMALPALWQAKKEAEAQLSRLKIIAHSGQKNRALPIVDLKNRIDPLKAFNSYFASDEELTDRLAKLAAAAHNSGLELKTAQYEMSGVEGLRLKRYTVITPLRGTYAQVRSFVEQAMQELDTLVLDQVSFRRTTPDSAIIDADVRMSIYMEAS